MKIVIAPDSFKGTLTASEVGHTVKDSFVQYFNQNAINADIRVVPIADGGEGTSTILLENLGGRSVSCMVKGPEGFLIEATYVILNNNTAVIEVAESSGLKHCHQLDTKKTTSYGLGEMMIDALDQKVSEIIICLGGSGTTDGGAGMAAALGVEFISDDEKVDHPTGEHLKSIRKICLEKMDPRIHQTPFKILTDVNNPLFGLNGAAHVYGPQKGATPDDVLLLDEGLVHFGKTLEDTFGKDCSSFPGAGAAGGLGAGCFAFLNAQVLPGIETVLQLIHFDETVADADIVITGEGRLDHQSFMGKAISGIIHHSKGKKVILICGDSTCSDQCLKENNIRVFAATHYFSKKESLEKPKEVLAVVGEKCAMYVMESIKK